MQTDTVSIMQIIKNNHISMTTKRTNRNPNMDNSANMDHWTCVLILRNGPMTAKSGPSIRKMTLTFSQGFGHHGAEPEVPSVLDCLASDAATIENSPSFEEWASDLGYDTDSRKAEQTFKACKHQAKRLRNFLGDDLYQQLLWNTERL